MCSSPGHERTPRAKWSSSDWVAVLLVTRLCRKLIIIQEVVQMYATDDAIGYLVALRRSSFNAQNSAVEYGTFSFNKLTGMDCELM